MTAPRVGGYFLRAPPRERAADRLLELGCERPPDREGAERETEPREGPLLRGRLDAPGRGPPPRWGVDMRRGALLREGLDMRRGGLLRGRLDMPPRERLGGRLVIPRGDGALRDRGDVLGRGGVERDRLKLLRLDGRLRGREDMPLRERGDVLVRGAVDRDRLNVSRCDGVLRGRVDVLPRDLEDMLGRDGVLPDRSSRLSRDGPRRTCVLTRPGERVTGDRLAAPLLRGRARLAPSRRPGDSNSLPTGLRRLTP